MAESKKLLGRPPLPVVAGVIWAGGELLVQRRGRGHGAGSLEFPGGKLEPGEQPRAALARELREEWGEGAKRLVIGRVLEVVRHDYPEPGPDVVVIFFEVRAPADQAWWRSLTPVDCAAIVRLRPEALREEEFLTADQVVAARLRDGG